MAQFLAYPSGEECGVISTFNWFLPAFPRIEEEGWGSAPSGMYTEMHSRTVTHTQYIPTPKVPPSQNPSAYTHTEPNNDDLVFFKASPLFFATYLAIYLVQYSRTDEKSASHKFSFNC